MERWICKRCNSKNQGNMKFCPVCHIPRPAVPAVLRDAEAPAVPLRSTAHKQPPCIMNMLRRGYRAAAKLAFLLHLAVLSASLICMIAMRGR